MDISPAEMLMHTTVRLECELKGGGISTGTGFFFSFQVDEQTQIPLIVTNKHVIQESVNGSFAMTRRASDGNPIIGSYETVALGNFENLWIQHPDSDVDLAVFPIAPLLHSAQE